MPGVHRLTSTLVMRSVRLAKQRQIGDGNRTNHLPQGWTAPPATACAPGEDSPCFVKSGAGALTAPRVLASLQTASRGESGVLIDWPEQPTQSAALTRHLITRRDLVSVDGVPLGIGQASGCQDLLDERVLPLAVLAAVKG